MHTCLTIAGFDPSSGAGVTADLAVFSAHGLFGTACITALTVQSTVGVRSSHPIAAQVVAETLACLHDDLLPAGVKIGMLAEASVVREVTAYLRRLGPDTPVVLDPVLRSSSGLSLLEDAGVVAMQSALLENVDWVTPNRAELAVLTGLLTRTDDETERAAHALRLRYPGLGVLATGGDGQGAADDLIVLADGTCRWLRARTIDSRATHGTGCAFSSALLCGLVAGLPPLAAAEAAKSYVRAAIARAEPLGHGRGPLRLDWPRLDGPESPWLTTERLK